MPTLDPSTLPVLRPSSSPRSPSRRSSRRAARRALRRRPRRRRLRVERRARAGAEALSGREDRPPPPAHEDGRGRAARPRGATCTASPASPTRTGRASRVDQGRARARRHVPPRAPLRVAVRRHARERSARGRPPRGERDQDRASSTRALDVTHPDLAAKSPETWDVVHRRTASRQRRPWDVRLLARRGLGRPTATGSPASAETPSS